MRRIVLNSPQGSHSLNDLVMDRSYIYIFIRYVSHRFDSIFTIDIFLWKFIQIQNFLLYILIIMIIKTAKNFPCHFFKEKLIKNTYRFVMLKMDKKIVVDVDRRKLFPHRSKKRSVAEYPANRTVFPPPLLPPWKAFRVAPAQPLKFSLSGSAN